MVDRLRVTQIYVRSKKVTNELKLSNWGAKEKDIANGKNKKVPQNEIPAARCRPILLVLIATAVGLK